MLDIDHSDKMHHYFSLMCRSDRAFLDGLRYFSLGTGLQQGEIMTEFPDSPDREEHFRELYPDSVGFYNDYDPPPYFVPVGGFLAYLDEACRRYTEDKEEEYKEKVCAYLKAIYERYGHI